MEQNKKREELSLSLLDEYRNTTVDDLYADVKKTVARRRRLRTLTRVAAVLIPAFIAAGVWYWYAGVKDTAGSGSRFDENAVLTFGDGQQVVLGRPDGRKLIAEGNGVAIIHADDGLSYERTGDGMKTGMYSTLTIPRGMTYALTLEDGSRVWLNAGSQLRFPTAFEGEQRRVYLEGEACFEIAHDAGRPFMVETVGQTLTVTGTVFNIYAYPDEAATYTTLLSGGVELSFGGQSIILRPGQQARLIGDDMNVIETDTDDVTLWKDGLFPFNDKTLEEIFIRLARWYDIEYVFDDPEAAELVLMGNPPVYDDIDPVLKIIGMTGEVSAVREGRVVHVGMKK